MRHSLRLLSVCAVLFVGGCETQQPHRNESGGILSGFDDVENPSFNADTHFAAGRLAESQGQPKRALLQYEQCLKLNPKHEGAHYRIAMVHTEQRQLDAAIEAWKKYVKVTGETPASWNNLGYCYETAGRFDEAATAYQQAIRRDGAYQPARVNYGLMLARQQRFDEARMQLSAVLPPAAVEYNLGSVYEQLGRVDLARASYEKSLEINPRFDAARKRLEALGATPGGMPAALPNAAAPMH